MTLWRFSIWPLATASSIRAAASQAKPASANATVSQSPAAPAALLGTSAAHPAPPSATMKARRSSIIMAGSLGGGPSIPRRSLPGLTPLSRGCFRMHRFCESLDRRVKPRKRRCRQMPTGKKESPKLVSSHDVPWKEWAEVPRIGARYRHLTRAAVGKDYHVGVVIEELAPGRQSAPAHYHLFEEEHLYILGGTATLRLGAGSHEMKAGDYVCLPAGQKAGHCLVNNSGTPCRYVGVGEHHPKDVAVYTDSNKVLLRGLGRVLDFGATRGYWDGEDTGLPARETGQPKAADPAPEAPMAPKPPIASQDVPWNEEGPGKGTRFGGRSKHLTHAAVGGNYHVGMLIESP